MRQKILLLLLAFFSFQLVAATTNNDVELKREIQQLQQQTLKLQTQLNQLQKKLVKQPTPNTVETKKIIIHHANPRTTPKPVSKPIKSNNAGGKDFHTSSVQVHTLDRDPESLEFYPTALMVDEHVVTYIAGTPVVTSPYLGSRPAFDGSDYIVNISSINRDIRLMQQRRRLYEAYRSIGYPVPNKPIIAISGKIEPVAIIGQRSTGQRTADLTLGAGELDAAAILNDTVEGYLSLAYDQSPPDTGGQRLANSSIDLNMGFVNIGNLDRSPFYFTGGQLFVPFGRFSSSMVSAPLPMILARTKARPFILGYKSQYDNGPFTALYGFRSDTTLGNAGIGGLNLGYSFNKGNASGEIGASVISSIDDSGGMQFNGSSPFTTFGGFASPTNGNESVHKVPAAGAHGYINIDRYSLTAEWVGATSTFRTQDLSFNGKGARPQAAQLEAGVTFKTFDKPASLSVSYQWTKEALALNLPVQRVSGVYNISIWKDTVESLEYRHDINYSTTQYANGAAPAGSVNAPIVGQGGAADTVLVQIGVYF